MTRWGGPELWRRTVASNRIVVAYWTTKLDRNGGTKRVLRTLYSGFDPATADELKTWAEAKGLQVKTFINPDVDDDHRR